MTPLSGDVLSARSRWVASALVLMLAGLVWLQEPRLGPLREAGFDLLQRLSPREPRSAPVTVVVIDDDSLSALGQWPWSRFELVQLLSVVNAAKPAAIGINILMAESDRLSPDRWDDPSSPALLSGQPSSDQALANAIRQAPVVLPIAGTPWGSAALVNTTPVVVEAPAAGAPVPLDLQHFSGAVTTIPILEQAAAGSGLISFDLTEGVVRRLPLVAAVGDTRVPGMALEMLRVAAGASDIRLSADGGNWRLHVADASFPVDADGTVRIYFSHPRLSRFVSAIDVLKGRVDTDLLRGRLVLISVAAVGLGAPVVTPLGMPMLAPEIVAQMLECLLDGTTLRRPAWAASAEAAMVLLLGLPLPWLAPRCRHAGASAATFGLVALPLLASWWWFQGSRTLVDGVAPALSLGLLMFGMLMLGLSQAVRRRRALEQEVQRQRLERARIEGELEAARRIQADSLPRPEALADDHRIDLHARLTPAREVGGDLYEFFMLDADRLLVLVGDVAGNGLSAAFFMAVSKALCKSAALRAPAADAGQVLSAAHPEIWRENAGELFMTAFCAIVDLGTGETSYCNAGHDNPFRVLPDGRTSEIEDGDGPPLCALQDFDYRGGRLQLARGETLVLLTDGVTESRSPGGDLYGRARVGVLLQARCREGDTARHLIDALYADVKSFATADAEPADDMTVVVLRWYGPADAGRPGAS